MDQVLSAAEKLYFRGKYSKVLRMLEPQVFQYRDSYRFYLLLGYSCLFTGDFGGGHSYLRRAEQLSPGDTSANLGIALVSAKRGETEEAIRIWLSIIENKGDVKEAQRGLRLIRESTEFSQIAMRLEEEKLDRYLRYPRKRKMPWRQVLLACVVLALGASIFLYVDPYSFRSKDITRPEIADMDFFSSNGSTGNQGAEFVMNEDEVRKKAKEILELMNDYRDNLARREINRLLLSTASEDVKEKARYLVQYLEEPNFATLKDTFTFNEVSSQPSLYEGCYIAWKGKSANIATRNDEISFDLLVGYHDEILLEGVVQVRLGFPVFLEENKKVEVLGKVILSGNDNSASRVFRLEGISIHKLVE
jgi:tetratricopeptide (TPR) repeat protein